MIRLPKFARRRHGAAQRGVSLIEALVALAVMGIGMLGLVGVQGTLRGNSDLAKQRSEAVRIAQGDIERWRAFAVLGATGGNGYGDLVEGTFPDLAIAGVNATFTRQRQVDLLAAPRSAKSLRVTVGWTDRSGDAQSVQLSTVIAGIAPELALTMAVAGAGDTLTQPGGRNRSIPIDARDFGTGSSDYVPPGASPGVAWRFDNVTGLITLCTTAVANTAGLSSSSDLSCGSNRAQLLAGFLRYAMNTVQPTTADIVDPAGPAPADRPLVSVNYTNTVTSGTQVCATANDAGGVYTAYRCAVPVVVLLPGIPPTWSGTVGFGNVGTTIIASSVASQQSAELKSCRYTQTPASYTLVAVPQINQNYVFIRAGNQPPPAVVIPPTPDAFECPAPTAAHQPV